MQFATAILFWVGIGAVIGVIAWRSQKGFGSYLADEGFVRQTTCVDKIVVREKELRNIKCWRGPLAPSIDGELVTGYITAPERRGFRYFLGVIVQPSAQIDDAWFHRWTEPDTFRTADGRYAVLWNLIDKREHAERVLAAFRASVSK
jgi:hypothetical protein